MAIRTPFDFALGDSQIERSRSLVSLTKRLRIDYSNQIFNKPRNPRQHSTILPRCDTQKQYCSDSRRKEHRPAF